MARPEKRPTDKKESRLQVRLTDDLKRKLALAAAKDGMDLSTFARHSMIQRARALGVDV